MKKIMFLLFIVLLASCKPAQLISNMSNTIERKDSTNEMKSIKISNTIKDKSKIVKDSVTIHPDGSISKSHIENNDVYFYENIYWYINNKIIVTRSIIKTIKVTIPFPVEKKLTWLQSIEIWIGKILLLLASLALLFFGAKYFLKLRKIIP